MVAIYNRLSDRMHELEHASFDFEPDIILAQISGLTLVLTKFSLFWGLLYFPNFSLPFWPFGQRDLLTVNSLGHLQLLPSHKSLTVQEEQCLHLLLVFLTSCPHWQAFRRFSLASSISTEQSRHQSPAHDKHMIRWAYLVSSSGMYRSLRKYA